MSFFFDSIKLCLFFILVFSIIFIINLSYENRVNIDGFAVPTLMFANSRDNPNINANKFNEYINQINNDFKGLNTEINNSDKSRDNVRNIRIYENVKKNKANSLKIKEMSENFIKTIKSKYNSQYISTFPNDKSNYAVVLNDKCLTVKGLCKEEYCTLDCQKNLYTTDSQKFSTERITSAADAAVAMNVPTSNISKKNIYPFNIFKSLVNNNCLTLSDDGITVEQCNLNNIQQQWEISPDENICVLN